MEPSGLGWFSITDQRAGPTGFRNQIRERDATNKGIEYLGITKSVILRMGGREFTKRVDFPYSGAHVNDLV